MAVEPLKASPALWVKVGRRIFGSSEPRAWLTTVLDVGLVRDGCTADAESREGAKGGDAVEFDCDCEG